MNSQDDQVLQISIEQAELAIKELNALNRLSSNKDFNFLINEGYFEKEAIRLVMLKADHAMRGEAHQESIIKQIDAIGGLRAFFSKVTQIGRMAEKTLQDDTQTLEEINSKG